MVTTKPWFSKSESEKSVSESRRMNLEFASSMSSDIHPSKNSSTHSSTYIYDTTVNAKYELQKTYLLAIRLVADHCAQELLKIKIVSVHLFNSSIINVFVKSCYETL